MLVTVFMYCGDIHMSVQNIYICVYMYMSPYVHHPLCVQLTSTATPVKISLFTKLKRQGAVYVIVSNMHVF